MKQPLFATTAAGDVRLVVPGHVVARTAVAISVLAVVAALGTMLAWDQKPEENTLPFVSDGGASDPERVVFGVGLSVVGMLTVVVAFLTHAHLHRELHRVSRQSGDHVEVDLEEQPQVQEQEQAGDVALQQAAERNRTAVYCGVLAGPNLLLLSMTPWTLSLATHLAFTFIFFTLFCVWAYKVVRIQKAVLERDSDGSDASSEELAARASALKWKAYTVGTLISMLVTIVVGGVVDQDQTVLLPLIEYVLVGAEALFVLLLSADLEDSALEIGMRT